MLLLSTFTAVLRMRRWKVIGWDGRLWLGEPRESGCRAACPPPPSIKARTYRRCLYFSPAWGSVWVCIFTLIHLEWKANRILCLAVWTSAAIFMCIWSESVRLRVIHFNYACGTRAPLQHMVLVKPGAAVSCHADLVVPGDLVWDVFRKVRFQSCVGRLRCLFVALTAL